MKIVKNHACEFVMVRYISEFQACAYTHVMSMYRLYQGTLKLIYFSFYLDESEE